MWKPCPQAQQTIDALVDDAKKRSPWLQRFERMLHEQTGERLVRRIDHLLLPRDAYAERLTEAGFEIDDTGLASHPEAYAPTIYLGPSDRFRLAIRVDLVDAFKRRTALHDPEQRVEGAEGAPLRRCLIAKNARAEVWAVERWGSIGWELDDRTAAEREAALRRLDDFRQRDRSEGDPKELARLFAELRAMTTESIAEIGPLWTAGVFFRAEREHWVQRTPAAQVQAGRHDALGLGWAHHDHHTYRSSRACFTELISVLELLGMISRESFHAGPEAGWGAQVMEHPDLPFVVFADVDMSEDELTGDFAHTPLIPRDSLGTVGLWCGLHGEALFGAGLHHLACHYDFDAVRQQLAQASVEVMPPFADLPELRQAFTVAERRIVDPRRAERLLGAGLITKEQAQTFASEGALGSHLEIIERKLAYRGFHQKGISSIIQRTDPRATEL